MIAHIGSCCFWSRWWLATCLDTNRLTLSRDCCLKSFWMIWYNLSLWRWWWCEWDMMQLMEKLRGCTMRNLQRCNFVAHASATISTSLSPSATSLTNHQQLWVEIQPTNLYYIEPCCIKEQMLYWHIEQAFQNWTLTFSLQDIAILSFIKIAVFWCWWSWG